MSELTLVAEFQGNVRVGTGRAGNGIDEAIDRDLPLGVGSLKGVLREEARWLMSDSPSADAEQDHDLVKAVFGSTREQCPWNFDIQSENDPEYQDRPSLRLDEEGRSVAGAFLVKEEAHIAQARINVYQRSKLSQAGLSNLGSELSADEIKKYHLALIHLSARAVEKMGQRRSRGLGWMAINLDAAPDEQVQIVKADLDLLWEIRNGGAK